MRMLCSNLNAHLLSLHVIDDAKCLCNYETEDNFHFLFECPLYHTQRQKMLLSINNLCNVNLDVLLYGDDNLDIETNKKIFDAVQEFIKLSERF